MVYQVGVMELCWTHICCCYFPGVGCKVDGIFRCTQDGLTYYLRYSPGFDGIMPTFMGDELLRDVLNRADVGLGLSPGADA